MLVVYELLLIAAAIIFPDINFKYKNIDDLNIHENYHLHIKTLTCY